MKINAIIVDDEKKARNVLRGQIERIAPEINIVEECDDILSAYQKINLHKPDVVFLDIQLQEGTGFDLLRKFGKIDFQVVFTTAYDEYAIKAIKFNALDYLMKPIHPQELRESIEKLKESLLQQNKYTQYHQTVLENLKAAKAQDQKLIIIESKNIRFISLKDIVLLTADGNYTNFKLISGKSFLSSKSTKHYYDLLEDKGFFRVHRSHIVNLNLVREISTKDGTYVEMENGETVIVAKERKKEFIDKLSVSYIH